MSAAMGVVAMAASRYEQTGGAAAVRSVVDRPYLLITDLDPRTPAGWNG